MRGGGCYVDDVDLPGVVDVVFLRSSVAAGRIQNLDLSSVRTHAAVRDVVTASDAGELGRLPVTREHPGLVHGFGPAVLADEHVCYVGEPIAAVVAASRYEAEDALELAEIDFDEAVPLVTPDAALALGAPVVHPHHSTNVAGMWSEETGDVAAALRSAPHRFSFRCSLARGAAQPLETRGVVARAEAGELFVWSPTQRPHGMRQFLASRLGLAIDAVQVVSPDTGGSFGCKAYYSSEDLLIPWLALRLGRPVRWIEDRSEHFLATFPEHRTSFAIEVGATSEGEIVALDVDFVFDLGAYAPYGFAVPQNLADHVLGPYRYDAARVAWTGVYTNKTPSAPYRGAGRPSGVFASERAMDVVARELGLDPAEVRRRNLVPRALMPYRTGLTTPAGELTYDSGDYEGCLDDALRTSDYAGWRARQASTASSDRLTIGIGVANYIECSLTRPWESAQIDLLEDGRFDVRVGVSAQGQGHATTLAHVASVALGVSPSQVRVTGGTTIGTPESIGTYGSRVAIMAGNAVHEAACKLLRHVLEHVARAESRSIDELTCSDAGVETFGQLLATWSDLACTQPFSADAMFELDAPPVANGTHVVVLELDRATGEVRILDYVVAHDAGRLLDVNIVEGQIIGAVAQGVGGSLFEELRYDDLGQLSNGSFMDYLLPTAVEVPAVRIVHRESPSPTNPLGVKGAGEGGILPSYAAIAAALEDALGMPVMHMPMTVDAIRATLAERDWARQ